MFMANMPHHPFICRAAKRHKNMFLLPAVCVCVCVSNPRTHPRTGGSKRCSIQCTVLATRMLEWIYSHDTSRATVCRNGDDDDDSGGAKASNDDDGLDGHDECESVCGVA